MSVTTKQGDQGDTSLYGGCRVSKTHPRMIVVGTLDELNSFLGWCNKPLLHPEMEPLSEIQRRLFDAGAEIASPDNPPDYIDMISASDVKWVESLVNQLEQDLPPLKNFVLPGGYEYASRLHIARTVARRAERDLVLLAEKEKVRAELLEFMNRISDLLFVMARYLNYKLNVKENIYQPRQ